MAKMTVRQKLSIATWSSPKEGNIYGKLELDASKVLHYIEELKAKTGQNITLTHFVGKVLAHALEQTPTLNGHIAWGKFVPHKTIDVTYLVVLDEGRNLAKAKINDTDKKSLTQISSELQEMAEKIRNGKDKNFQSSINMLKILPTFLIKPLLKILAFLTVDIGIEAQAFGLEARPFGSCVVTSVGMFGIDEAYAPPTPFAKVPLLVLLGAIKDQPVVINKQLETRPMVTLTATIDHRFVDGYQIASLAQVVKKLFENPHLISSSLNPSK